MRRLPDDQRLASKLSFLGQPGRDHLLRYMLALSARQYAPATVEAVITVVRRFLRDLPPERRDALSGDLSGTKPHDITAFVEAAQGAGLAPSTINLSLSVLSEFFDFLRDDGLMQTQPVIRRRHRLLAPATLPKPIPEHDPVTFFKAVDSQRDRLLFLVMLRCGLRVSEACGLRWDDYDAGAGSIRVNDGKGHVDRVVYVSPDLARELKAWQAKAAGSPYLFPSRKRKGRPIDRRVVNVMMGDYLLRAGIHRSYTPHCLRHTFATQLLNAGVTLEVLKELMGHRSIQNTLKYAQLYEVTKRRQYDDAMGRVEGRQAVGGRR